jgi:hypothetical protein
VRASSKNKGHGREPNQRPVEFAWVQKPVGGIVTINATVPMDVAIVLTKAIHAHIERSRTTRASKSRRRDTDA